MIPVEIFAAKDSSGTLQDVMLSVPVNCGLKYADSLRIQGRRLLALDQQTILPIDLPLLEATHVEDLVATATRHGQIAVAEFTALGLFDNYLLKLEVGRTSQAGSNAFGN